MKTHNVSVAMTQVLLQVTRKMSGESFEQIHKTLYSKMNERQKKSEHNILNT